MRAVVFDMDGLMIDSEKIYWAVGRQMAKEFGKSVSDETLGRMMGRAPLESAAVFAQEVGLSLSPREVLDEREARVAVVMQGGVEPMPGLFEALDRLGARFDLAIATSAPGRFVEIVLDTLKLHGRFKAVQTSDDITRGKPDPEIYLKAMGRLGVPPTECFVLEDSSNGARAGKNAGGYVIAVPTEHTRSQDFSFVDFIAADLTGAADHVLEVAGATRRG